MTAGRVWLRPVWVVRPVNGDTNRVALDEVMRAARTARVGFLYEGVLWEVSRG